MCGIVFNGVFNKCFMKWVILLYVHIVLYTCAEILKCVCNRLNMLTGLSLKVIL